jgi:DNA-binding transcriptional MerR regulator
MPTALDNARAPIPDKFYFRVGEVSRIAGVQAHVLRFWESEFSQIRPKRTDSGQRLYRRKDVETILDIKDLLYRQKFTIPGARQYLRQRKDVPTPMRLSEIREELLAIRSLLDKTVIG